MSKEITKAYILQQLQDKFKLRELEPEKFTFLESVRPVYDIGPHLLQHNIDKFSAASISGIGAITLKTVPFNERWTIHRYNCVFVSGAYTIAGIYITRGDPALFTYLDLKAAQDTAYAINLPVPAILNSGDKLHVNVDGYTSAGVFWLYVDATIEEIR